MNETNFTRWCREATWRIRYGPDRAEVYQELMDHLRDHRDALMAQGAAEEDAAAQAVEAMGSAKEIALELEKIHKPFWGYCLQVCKLILVILLCLCVIPIWDYAAHLDIGTYSHYSFDIYDSTSYGGDTGRQLLHLSKPGVSFSSDGNIFVLTDAAIFAVNSQGDGQEKPRLYVQIRQSSLLPWTEHQTYYDFFPISARFSARDSLGNYYPCYSEQHSCDAPHVNAMGRQSGIFSYTHTCWINDFHGADAEWVDICYERDGRSYTLRIDLMGGDQE